MSDDLIDLIFQKNLKREKSYRAERAASSLPEKTEIPAGKERKTIRYYCQDCDWQGSIEDSVNHYCSLRHQIVSEAVEAQHA